MQRDHTVFFPESMKAVREPRGPVSLPRVLSSSLQLLSRAPAATVVDNCFLCCTHEQQ